MINRLRALFETLSLREKVLTAGFLWVLTALWLNWLFTGLRGGIELFSANSEVVEVYEARIEQKPAVDAELAEMRARFDKVRTKDSAELQGHIARLLRTSGLTAKRFPVKTDAGDVFDWHEMALTLENAGMRQVINFQQLVLAESPYINFDRVRIAGDRNEEQLDVVFAINSFELKAASAETTP